MPSPPPAADAKRRKVLPHEGLFLASLPCSSLYERSYMHRDTLSHALTTRYVSSLRLRQLTAVLLVGRSGFVVTASVDGYIKFWRKNPADPGALDFVKTYRAHSGPITGLAADSHGHWLASVSLDRSMKLFDIANFGTPRPAALPCVTAVDMVNMVKLDYVPAAVCWAAVGQRDRLFCADKDSPRIYLYTDINCTAHEAVLETHQAPVSALKFDPAHGTMISADTQGALKYWAPHAPYAPPSGLAISPAHLADAAPSSIGSLELSPDSAFFATMSADRQVRVYRTATGKLYRKYDESLPVYSAMQAAGKLAVKLDDLEFGKRLAVERDIESAPYASLINAVFDESGNFLLYPTMVGIKVLNLVTNRVAAYLGSADSCRFLNVALLQSLPADISMDLAASENPVAENVRAADPLVLATAYKKPRLYLISRRDPDKDHLVERDVLNERPSKDDLSAKAAVAKSLPTQAIIRTTFGDIVLRLLPQVAPLAVENFSTHAKNGYYDNLLFHRVIQNFMVQTGDPFGDGTGGESIWGADFRDEVQPDVKHDVPFTVSMANAGPNTNGSQFFITTVKCPWLDGKHTIFGRVVRGADVVSKIENVKTDDLDKPESDIKILQIDLLE